MPLGDLSRSELIDLVRRIQRGEGTEEETQRMVRRFDESVPHPESTALIFWPDQQFGPDHGEPTPEQIVDRALAYKAIEL